MKIKPCPFCGGKVAPFTKTSFGPARIDHAYSCILLRKGLAFIWPDLFDAWNRRHKEEVKSDSQ